MIFTPELFGTYLILILNIVILAGYIVILGLSSFYFCLAAISLRWVKKLEAGEEN
jgi:hypothetical protein